MQTTSAVATGYPRIFKLTTRSTSGNPQIAAQFSFRQLLLWRQYPTAPILASGFTGGSTYNTGYFQLEARTNRLLTQEGLKVVTGDNRLRTTDEDIASEGGFIYCPPVKDGELLLCKSASGDKNQFRLSSSGDFRDVFFVNGDQTVVDGQGEVLLVVSGLASAGYDPIPTTTTTTTTSTTSSSTGKPTFVASGPKFKLLTSSTDANTNGKYVSVQPTEPEWEVLTEVVGGASGYTEGVFTLEAGTNRVVTAAGFYLAYTASNGLFTVARDTVDQEVQGFLTCEAVQSGGTLRCSGNGGRTQFRNRNLRSPFNRQLQYANLRQQWTLIIVSWI